MGRKLGQRMTIRLRRDQYAWLQAESKATGRSMSAIIRDAIDAYFGLPPWDGPTKTLSSEIAR